MVLSIGMAKRHVAVDDGSKPIALALSPGNTYDSNVFNELYDKINRKGLYAGSAYDTDEVRLKADGVEANMNGGPCNVGGLWIDEISHREVQRMLKTFRRAIIGYGGWQ